MSGNKSGVSGIEVLRAKDGRAFISVDSLVELFEDMADKMAGGPAEKSFHRLVDTFRPLSSYAAIKDAAASDDGSRPVARCCACGAPVIDAEHIDGSTVIVDADQSPNGGFFVFGVQKGHTKVATWEPKLDGMSVVRLRGHSCDEGTP